VFGCQIADKNSMTVTFEFP